MIITSRPARRCIAALLLVLPAVLSFSVAPASAQLIEEPTVRISSPVHGAFTTNSSVTVTGKVDGLGSAISLLTVNGKSVSVSSNGSFSTTVPVNASKVFNPIVARMTTILGAQALDRVVVIAGNSVDASQIAANSLAVRISRRGIERIQDLLADFIGLDLSLLLPEGTLLVDDFCVVKGFFGCLSRVDVRVSGSKRPQITELGIDLAAQSGVLGTTADLFGVSVRADVKSPLGLTRCTIDYEANGVAYSQIALGPDPNDNSQIRATQLGGVDLQLDRLRDNTNCAGLFGFITESLVDDTVSKIEAELHKRITAFLDSASRAGATPFEDALNQALGEINPSGPIGSGDGVELFAPFFSVTPDANGIAISMGARSSANLGSLPGLCNPPEGAPSLGASYASSSPAPVFAQTRPDGSLFDVGVGISMTVFNQLLRAQTECGFLSGDITLVDSQPITAGLMRSFGDPAFGQFAPDMKITLRLQPTLAPIATVAPMGTGVDLDLRLSHLSFELIGELAPFGPKTLAKGVVDLATGMLVGFDAQASEIQVSVNEVTRDDARVVFTENPNLLADIAVSHLLALVLNELSPLAGESFAVPVPRFLSTFLERVEVVPFDESLGLFVDLRNPG